MSETAYSRNTIRHDLLSKILLVKTECRETTAPPSPPAPTDSPASPPTNTPSPTPPDPAVTAAPNETNMCSGPSSRNTQTAQQDPIVSAHIPIAASPVHCQTNPAAPPTSSGR